MTCNFKVLGKYMFSFGLWLDTQCNPYTDSAEIRSTRKVLAIDGAILSVFLVIGSLLVANFFQIYDPSVYLGIGITSLIIGGLYLTGMFLTNVANPFQRLPTKEEEKEDQNYRGK